MKSVKRDDAKVFVDPWNKRVMEGFMEDTDGQTFQHGRLKYVLHLY